MLPKCPFFRSSAAWPRRKSQWRKVCSGEVAGGPKAAQREQRVIFLGTLMDFRIHSICWFQKKPPTLYLSFLFFRTHRLFTRAELYLQCQLRSHWLSQWCIVPTTYATRVAGLGDIVGFERQFLEFPPKSFIVREVFEWDISPRDISPTVGAHKKIPWQYYVTRQWQIAVEMQWPEQDYAFIRTQAENTTALISDCEPKIKCCKRTGSLDHFMRKLQ